MRNEELKKIIGDMWPKTMPLDNPADEASKVHSLEHLSKDAQDLRDWMRRVRKNYPELYISEENNEYDSKSQDKAKVKK